MSAVSLSLSLSALSLSLSALSALSLSMSALSALSLSDRPTHLPHKRSQKRPTVAKGFCEMDIEASYFSNLINQFRFSPYDAAWKKGQGSSFQVVPPIDDWAPAIDAATQGSGDRLSIGDCGED